MTHFQNFLGVMDHVYPIDDTENLFIKKIESNAAMYMIRDVLDEEIKAAIFDIDDERPLDLMGLHLNSSRHLGMWWGVMCVRCYQRILHQWKATW